MTFRFNLDDGSREVAMFGTVVRLSGKQVLLERGGIIRIEKCKNNDGAYQLYRLMLDKVAAQNGAAYLFDGGRNAKRVHAPARSGNTSRRFCDEG